MGGLTEIWDSNFTNIVTHIGVIEVSSGENLKVTGSRFTKIMGVQRSSIMFLIQNEELKEDFIQISKQKSSTCLSKMNG